MGQRIGMYGAVWGSGFRVRLALIRTCRKYVVAYIYTYIIIHVLAMYIHM